MNYEFMTITIIERGMFKTTMIAKLLEICFIYKS